MELKNKFSEEESFSWGSYSKKAMVTSNNNSTEHAVMGVIGELGELIEEFSSGNPESTIKEIGDFLWYLNLLVNSLGGNLEDVIHDFIESSEPSEYRDIQCITNFAEGFKKDIFYKNSSKKEMLDRLKSWLNNEFKFVFIKKLIEYKFVTEKINNIMFDIELESIVVHAAITNIEKLKVRYPSSKFDLNDFKERVDVEKC